MNAAISGKGRQPKRCKKKTKLNILNPRIGGLGRCFSFSKGVFSGSMFVFRGVPTDDLQWFPPPVGFYKLSSCHLTAEEESFCGGNQVRFFFEMWMAFLRDY